jgi:hypothetical protein
MSGKFNLLDYISAAISITLAGSTLVELIPYIKAHQHPEKLMMTCKAGSGEECRVKCKKHTDLTIPYLACRCALFFVFAIVVSPLVDKRTKSPIQKILMWLCIWYVIFYGLLIIFY